jgi:hypothetical protein
MSAPQKAKRSWPQDIMRDPYIKSRDDDDGLYIICLPCSINLGTDVTIKTKDAFTKHRWLQHAQKCQKHAENVRQYDYLQEQKKTKPVQLEMRSFFAGTESAKTTNKRYNLTSATETRRHHPKESNFPTAKRAAKSCYGVLMNTQPGGKVSAALQVYHKYSAIPETVVMQKYDATLCHRMFSPECDGIVKKGWSEVRCENCENLRLKHGKNLLKKVNNRSSVFNRMEGALFKSHLCDMDREDMGRFLKTQDIYLSHCGISLKLQVKRNLEFIDECLELDKMLLSKKLKSSGSTIASRIETGSDSPDVFLSKFLSLYKTNPEFASSLICGLLRAAVAKMSGQKNPQYATHVLNFYSMIETSSRKSFEMVSANLYGPSLRQMQRVNGKQRNEPIVCEETSHLTKRLGIFLETTLHAIKNPVFSLSIDATKLPEAKQLSLAHKAVFGGAYPNHFISVEDKTAEHLKGLIEDNESPRRAQEIKVVVVAVQRAPIGTCPYFILAARPQTKNAASDFNDKVISTCVTHCETQKRGRLLNFAVDGVSVESKSVWTTTCMFLAGKANYLGTTDTNHNMKSVRYQIIGGSCLGVCGNHPLDAGFLRLAKVPVELWRVSDYASDLLVLRLTAAKTIGSLADLLPLPNAALLQDSMAVAVLALQLYFMRLHLYAVNSKELNATSRVTFMWATMIWMTSITNVSIITKRNIVSATIGMCFLMLRSDVPNPRHATSEPSEHVFGTIRSEKREFTTLEFVELCEKMDRKLKAMYESKLKQYRSPKRGYQATFNDFLKATMDTQETEGGPVDVEEGKSVVEQLWPTLRLIINSTNVKMVAMMHSFGFSVQDCSPFSVQFDKEPDHLQKIFISYLPRTFVFDGVEGSQNDNNEGDAEGDEMGASNAGEPGGIVDGERGGGIVKDQAVVDVINSLLADGKRDDRRSEEEKSDEDAIEVMDDEVDAIEAMDDELDFFGPGLDTSQAMKDFASILITTQTPTFTAKALVDMILEATANVELKKREQASTSDKQKAKSLISRWFQKEEKDKKPTEGATEDSSYLERDRLVKLDCSTETTYRVLEVWTKHYNKWYLSKEPRKKWSKPFAAGVCKISLRMVEYDHAFQQYKDVIPAGNHGMKQKQMHPLIDASIVASLQGKVVRTTL